MIIVSGVGEVKELFVFNVSLWAIRLALLALLLNTEIILFK